jgi:hypothetical protein
MQKWVYKGALEALSQMLGGAEPSSETDSRSDHQGVTLVNGARRLRDDSEYFLSSSSITVGP